MSDTEQHTCRRFLISGRVQGVFFRASTRDVALKLSLAGYARNLPDGNVEVIASGEAAALAKLATWLRAGPRMASVTNVDEEEVKYQHFDRFTAS